MNNITIGSRVKRKPQKCSYYNDKEGTVIKLIDERAYIKWDDISKTTYTYSYKGKTYTKTTNQQHSTVNLKRLDLI